MIANLSSYHYVYTTSNVVYGLKSKPMISTIEMNPVEQFKRMNKTFKSGKYSNINYNESSKIILFSNVSPLRKKCFYCDDMVWELFAHEIID